MSKATNRATPDREISYPRLTSNKGAWMSGEGLTGVRVSGGSLMPPFMSLNRHIASYLSWQLRHGKPAREARDVCNGEAGRRPRVMTERRYDKNVAINTCQDISVARRPFWR